MISPEVCKRCIRCSTTVRVEYLLPSSSKLIPFPLTLAIVRRICILSDVRGNPNKPIIYENANDQTSNIYTNSNVPLNNNGKSPSCIQTITLLIAERIINNCLIATKTPV